MNEQQITALIKEIRDEQQISPMFPDSTIKNYVVEAEFDINNSVGYQIDYSTDLIAKSLLKNYVLYANHKRLAEFKELYNSDYVKLQIKYYRDPNIY